MSEQSRTLRASSTIDQGKRAASRRRWAVYAGLACAIVLVLAYIDAGEEPLRPIVHRIALPIGGGEQP
ncbi:hypothetical protein [Qipengyuania nanhaisediminis]|uniref:hypothetical protein n=1 Tax=Qipengyuania nanhaisediminis TaxID=604088 RepID=UPI0038B3327F